METKMTPSKRCIDLVKEFEGLFLNAYKCPAGVTTIGYGSIMWPDGMRIQMGQKVTVEGAEKLLAWELEKKGTVINAWKLKINQSQFDALLSFAYNLGIGNLNSSTLLKKVKINANDPTIVAEFMKWNKARVNGKLTELKGLTRRRKAESDLYFRKD
jgi:lysozyme